MIPVFTHPACLAHDPGPGHPEQPERLRVLLDRLGTLPMVERRESPEVARDLLLTVHDASYLTRLEALAEAGGGELDADTKMNSASWEAALRSAGGAVAAADHALDHGSGAFSAGRPPGHHALRGTAMGFCLLGNVVLAARRALGRGASRVLIVDWDVHHGNGTQALVERDPAIRFVSLHQWPWWPGTGDESERGAGNIFNVPRPPGLPPTRYVEDLWAAVRQAISNWPPDLVIISAGFDTMAGDPLGGFTLEPEHYAGLTTRLREAAAPAPVISVLEGGYIPSRLADGVAAHLAALA
jgi:acetoin utilization deacetylase AcuC-like enzyme